MDTLTKQEIRDYKNMANIDMPKSTNDDMKTIPQSGPQIITIFIPRFRSHRVMMRHMVIGDDWVQSCYDMDQKYGVWFTTYEQAKQLLR